ncbi:MAG: hypothetical protein ABI415_00535 [Flavitalea sp.]
MLHSERIDKDIEKVTYEENVDDLPNGAFLLLGNEFHLWTPFRYKDKRIIPSINKIAVLTPASIINTFHAGYACLVSK